MNQRVPLPTPTPTQVNDSLANLHNTLDSDLVSEITLSVGAASTCWIGGTGQAEFDTDMAKMVVLRLAEWILERYSKNPRLDEQFEVKVNR